MKKFLSAVYSFIRRYLKQIVLFLVGAIVSAVLFSRRKEEEFLSKIGNKIDTIEGESKAKADEFKAKLEIVKSISNKLERMESLLKLWQDLDQD